MNVLIVMRSDDNESVDMVAAALRARGAHPIRLNSDLYPTHVHITTCLEDAGSRRSLADETGRRFDLAEISALWYRRFFAGGQIPTQLGDTRTACVNEARRTLHGSIATLDCFKLDPLMAVRSADHKELQLARARARGLDVPRTMFSNDPEQILSFWEALDGNVVAKMQSSFAIYRDDREMVVFTSVVRKSDLRDLAGLKYSPMIFQERLDKSLELRATVVGKRILTACVDSQRSATSAVDWRRDGPGLMNNWRPYELPEPVAEGLLALMEDFGLNYGAADFVVTPEGRHVFLEVNAGGEWFWLQLQPGLPIAEALADVLTARAVRTSQPG
jgi:glutathione synthase/RimK-type ligase-like ATP-grasp enzyme